MCFQKFLCPLRRSSVNCQEKGVAVACWVLCRERGKNVGMGKERWNDYSGHKQRLKAECHFSVQPTAQVPDGEKVSVVF